MIAIFASMVALVSAAADDTPAVDAAEAFLTRQSDLIELATHLGALHRMRQVCGDPYSTDLFRNRMKELVPLEAPMGRTRLDMITGFNAGYREASHLYLACNETVEDAYTRRAEQALRVTNRLYAPFR